MNIILKVHKIMYVYIKNWEKTSNDFHIVYIIIAVLPTYTNIKNLRFFNFYFNSLFIFI